MAWIPPGIFLLPYSLRGHLPWLQVVPLPRPRILETKQDLKFVDCDIVCTIGYGAGKIVRGVDIDFLMVTIVYAARRRWFSLGFDFLG